MKEVHPIKSHSTDLTSSTPRLRVMIANAVAELGGAEQVMLALAERLPTYGIEVSFALLRPGPLQKLIESKGIRVYVFPEEYRFRNVSSIWRCVRWLTQCIREDGADILHSNLTAHFIGGWAAKRAKVHELWHLHDHPGKFDPVHALSRRVATDFVIFTTEYLKTGEPALRRTPHRVISPNSVDVGVIQETPRDPLVRGRLGIGSSPFFLTVTRLQQHKGHIYLIQAAAEVAKAHPEIHWVIAGRPRGEEQTAYFQQLREQVAAAGMLDRIHFVGFVSNGDLIPLYKEALAFVHPAITETYGLVLLEAMACQLPVLAADASGPAEILTNERNGLLVPVRNAPALAQAMLRILEDTDFAQRLAKQASVDVATRSVDKMVEETIECYDDMLRTPRKAPNSQRPRV